MSTNEFSADPDAFSELGIYLIFGFAIASLPPYIGVTVRRLHDINQSGWMQCIFIPGFFADTLLGTGYVIYIVTLALWAFWFSQAGKKSKNRCR